MGEELRPRRVVVVDADNPLREVEGEFFWREDHEVLLEQARVEAYRRGYADAVTAAGQTRFEVVLRHRRRRPLVGRLAVLLSVLLGVFVVVAFVVQLVGALTS
jgi:hypothetical protein